VALIAICTTSALGDPPITPPTDPSYIPDPVGTYTVETPAYHQLKASGLQSLKRQVRLYRKSDCHWRSLMGKRCVRTSQLVLHTRSVAYVNLVLKQTKSRSGHDHGQAKRWMLKRVGSYRRQANYLREMLGISIPRGRQLESASIEAVYNAAKKQAEDLAEQWGSSPLLSAFLCIHHYEGAWDANTGNGYYGGLQEDRRFQSQYGPEFVRRWGTADNWPVWAQFLSALRAYRSGRGFYPWPNTARACGLI